MTNYEEMQKNRQFISLHRSENDTKVLDVDTRKVTYQGRPWHELDSMQKKKFENLFVLAEPKQRLRFTYH